MFLAVMKFLSRPVPALLLVLLVGTIVYANTFQVPFTLDDEPSIVANPDIRSLEHFHASPTRYVAYLTFALNYHFGGLDVTGYHVVNLLIHLMAAVLVYVLLRLTFRTPFFKTGSGGEAGSGLGETSTSMGALGAPLQAAAFIPFFAALLFVAHPVQTQAVTYVVQRLTSLATMFYLLSVVLYVVARLWMEQGAGFGIRDSKSQPQLESAPKSASFWVILPFAGSVLAAILAMKTKEIAFTLPLAIMLYELYFFQGAWKRRLYCLLPLLATLPIIPLSVLAGNDSAGDVLSDISEKSTANVGMSRLDYLFTQFRVIVTYLRLLVLPVNQNLDYDFPVYTTFFTPPVFLSSLLLAIIFVVSVYFFLLSGRERQVKVKGNAGSGTSVLPQPQPQPQPQPVFPSTGLFRLVSFGIFWFFLTLAVESSIVPITDVIFEHRLYLPSFGAVSALATAYFLLSEKIFKKNGWGWIAGTAFLIVACLGVATYQRNHVWGNELRLWLDTATKSPEKGRPLNNFAVALENVGKRAEAIEVLFHAIEVEPTYYRSYYNLGDLFIVSGRPQEALPPLQAAIELKPDFTLAYVKIGAALIRGRQFSEAAIFLEQNLERIATHGEGRFYLGAAYAFLGNREAALREQAVISTLDPALARDLAGLLNRGSGH